MSSESESSRQKSQKPVQQSFRIDEWRNENILLEQIIKALKQFPESYQNLASHKFNQRMLVKAIGKKPTYIADSSCCIQAVFKSEVKMDIKEPNPFNELNTQFYGGHLKPHLVWNCHDETVSEQAPKYPSAYHPAFHYKNYEQFVERRKTASYSESCQKLEIKSWSIAIVNISKKGYYAPLLVIHEFKRHNGQAYLQSSVQNILFYQQISVFLEAYRLNDIRRKKIQVVKNKFNFPYYIKSQTKKKQNVKLSKFVTLDTKNIILECNQSLTINFVPYGKLSQSQLFKRPVLPKFLSKRQQINLKKFQFEVQVQQRQDNDNSSSSFIERQDQDEDYDRRRPGGEDQDERDYAMDDDSNYFQPQIEQQSDQQDYLKKAYEKAMRKQHFI